MTPAERALLLDTARVVRLLASYVDADYPLPAVAHDHIKKLDAAIAAASTVDELYPPTGPKGQS